MSDAINRSNRATLIGWSGLCMWAFSAFLVMALENLPVYEILSITFFISFILSMTYTVRTGRLQLLIKRPLYLWIAGAVGVTGQIAFYITAAKSAPILHVDLIAHLWPLMVVSFSFLLPGESFCFKSLIAALIGLSGVFVLTVFDGNQGDIAGVEPAFLFGYVCALLGGVAWAIYSLAAGAYNRSAPEMIGIYCGIALLFSLFMHFKYEVTIIPSLYEAAILLLIGCTTQSCAYFCWDHGVKYGNLNLLSVLSYGNPLLSSFILILAGLAEPSLYLLFAVVMLFIAGILAGTTYIERGLTSLFRVAFPLRQLDSSKSDS